MSDLITHTAGVGCLNCNFKVNFRLEIPGPLLLNAGRMSSRLVSMYTVSLEEISHRVDPGKMSDTSKNVDLDQGHDG